MTTTEQKINTLNIIKLTNDKEINSLQNSVTNNQMSVDMTMASIDQTNQIITENINKILELTSMNNIINELIDDLELKLTS